MLIPACPDPIRKAERDVIVSLARRYSEITRRKGGCLPPSTLARIIETFQDRCPFLTVKKVEMAVWRESKKKRNAPTDDSGGGENIARGSDDDDDEGGEGSYELSASAVMASADGGSAPTLPSMSELSDAAIGCRLRRRWPAKRNTRGSGWARAREIKKNLKIKNTVKLIKSNKYALIGITVLVYIHRVEIKR